MARKIKVSMVGTADEMWMRSAYENEKCHACADATGNHEIGQQESYNEGTHRLLT